MSALLRESWTVQGMDPQTGDNQVRFGSVNKVHKIVWH